MHYRVVWFKQWFEKWNISTMGLYTKSKFAIGYLITSPGKEGYLNDGIFEHFLHRQYNIATLGYANNWVFEKNEGGILNSRETP